MRRTAGSTVCADARHRSRPRDRWRRAPLRSTLATAAAAALIVAATAPAQTPPQDGRRAIEILARRYAFEPAVVEVTAGEPVRLVVRSADGVHGFAIRTLGIAREIPRGGEAVVIELVAGEAGRFPIVCSEYCGSGHEDMTGTLIVHARATPGDDAPAPGDGAGTGTRR